MSQLLAHLGREGFYTRIELVLQGALVTCGKEQSLSNLSVSWLLICCPFSVFRSTCVSSQFVTLNAGWLQFLSTWAQKL